MNAVKSFVSDLASAEQKTDAALQSFSALMIAAQRTASDLNLKFGEPHAVYADLSEAIALQVKSRQYLARAHAKALQLAESKNIGEHAWGDFVPTYNIERDGPVAEITPLRSVA